MCMRGFAVGLPALVCVRCEEPPPFTRATRTPQQLTTPEPQNEVAPMLRTFTLLVVVLPLAHALATLPIRVLRPIPIPAPRAATYLCAEPTVPTSEDLEAALDNAHQAMQDALKARAKADELAQMPYFKKGDEEAKKQRLHEAREWGDKADALEQAAFEAKSTADLVLARINQHELEEAEAEELVLREELGAEEYEKMRTPSDLVYQELNGSEDRGGDINGIVSITMPTVLAVLALPALAAWMNQQF